jgi:hypothetical protein
MQPWILFELAKCSLLIGKIAEETIKNPLTEFQTGRHGRKPSEMKSFLIVTTNRRYWRHLRKF